jgi:hypothetical protein
MQSLTLLREPQEYKRYHIHESVVQKAEIVNVVVASAVKSHSGLCTE